LSAAKRLLVKPALVKTLHLESSFVVNTREGTPVKPALNALAVAHYSMLLTNWENLVVGTLTLPKTHLRAANIIITERSTTTSNVAKLHP
jgi:hypothetical protein